MSLRTTLACCLFLATAPALASFTMTVDSDLNEWLPGAPSGSSADDWTPVDGHGIKYFVEDQTGERAYLGPGWGGQDYDAEAVYAQRSATHLNFAIVTGRAPDADGFVAGDIAIDFGLDGTFEYGVVTLTDELALEQAERADRELAAGRYRGPLHGIPWGAKDLIAYPGYRTTWGAGPFKDQKIDQKATVGRQGREVKTGPL